MIAKALIAAVSAGGLLLAVSAQGATPALTPVKVSTMPANTIDASNPSALIKVGDANCPAPPASTVSEKMKEVLSLVSTTCAMRASGLISQSEAQSVYDQAMAIITIRIADLYSQEGTALASK